MRMKQILSRALLIWLVILGMAFVNGALRELLLVQLLGLPSALVLSGLLLSAAIVAVARLSICWIGATTYRQSMAIGMLWFFATLAFEFAFGIGVQQKSIEAVLTAYTFDGGNLWPMVLLVTLLSPVLSYRQLRR